MAPNFTARLRNSCNMDLGDAYSTPMGWINRYRTIKPRFGSVDLCFVHTNNDILADLLDNNSMFRSRRQDVALVYSNCFAVSIEVFIAYFPIKDQIDRADTNSKIRGASWLIYYDRAGSSTIV